MSVHGGPEWHERDRFDPETQAFVDAGYAVALVNYRGSTGYGVAFRRALIGAVCFTETEDIIAGLDAWNARASSILGGCTGAAGPGAAAWRASTPASIPIGGARSSRASLPATSWRRITPAPPSSRPGTTPCTAARRSRSPTRTAGATRRPAAAVTAPVLVIAGENNPRCPLEGILPWVDAVRARGVDVDLQLYPEGHHANAVDERVHHMELILDFFARNP